MDQANNPPSLDDMISSRIDDASRMTDTAFMAWRSGFTYAVATMLTAGDFIAAMSKGAILNTLRGIEAAGAAAQSTAAQAEQAVESSQPASETAAVEPASGTTRSTRRSTRTAAS